MRGFLRQLHRWVGLPLGILFLVTLVSGVITGGEEFVRAIDNKGQDYRPTTLEEDVRAIEKITSEVRRINAIVMPTPQTPFYQARTQTSTKTYRVGDLKLIKEKTASRDGFFETVLRLHRGFLLGREGFFGLSGPEIAAWVSLIVLGLGLMGVYLWWRVRRSFGFRKLIPASGRKHAYFQAHINGGIVTVVMLLILGFTGAAMTYRDVARSTLGAERVSSSGLEEVPLYVEDNWEAWLRKAEAKMPDAELAMISFPRQRGASDGAESGGVKAQAAIQFRYISEKDWLGVAGSRVYIEPAQSAYLGAVRFDALPFGQKLYTMIVPLHTGRNVSPTYLGVMLVFTALAVVMTFSGVISMVIQLIRRR